MIRTFFKAKNSFLWILNINVKSELTWPVCPKNMKLKQKWSRSNDYSQKCCFYWVITWKLLFSSGELALGWGGGEITIWCGGSLLGGDFSSWGRGGMIKFSAVGGTPPIPLSRENPAKWNKFQFNFLSLKHLVIHS